MFVMPIGNEAFEAADRDGFALDAAHAFAFALVFLRADASADGRQAGRLMDDPVSGFKIAFGDLSDKIGNMDFDGTSADARVIFTAEAAFSFIDGLFGGIAESDFFEIFIAHVRCLGRHRIFLKGHIRHF